MSSVATAMQVKVLWMDDETASIENYREMLEKERGIHYLKIDIVTSIKEARERLRSDEYAALIVDCRMDPHSREENGAKFLRQVNEDKKHFPTFVYSAFLHDSQFRRYLKESHPIKTVIRLRSQLNDRLQTIGSQKQFRNLLFRLRSIGKSMVIG